MVERGFIQFGHINGYTTIKACCTSPRCMPTAFNRELAVVLDKHSHSVRDVLSTSWLDNTAWRVVPTLTGEEAEYGGIVFCRTQINDLSVQYLMETIALEVMCVSAMNS